MLIKEIDVRRSSRSDELAGEQMKRFIADIGVRRRPRDEQSRHGSENYDGEES